MITIAQLESSLQGKTGGRKLTNIPNIYSVIQEVLNKMMVNVALPSAIRKQPLLTPFQEEPYLRLLPNDISLEGFIDAYQRAYDDVLPRVRTGVFSTEFMRKYGEGLIGIEHLEGSQYLNLKDSDYNTVYVLDNCYDSTNGTWQAIGTTTDIAYDTTHKLVGPASVKFTTPVTTGDFGVFKDDFADVASATDRAYITMQAFFPQYITSVTIKYGLDASNYKTVSATTNYLGKRFTTGWNTIAFDLSTATTVGTVGTDDISYFAYIISDNITVVPPDSFRIDAIYLTDAYTYDLTYYSNSVVQDEWGERRPNNLIASVNDMVLLNEVELDLFLQQFSVITSIDNRPASGITEYNVYSKSLQQSYDQFRLRYPSRKILMSSSY